MSESITSQSPSKVFTFTVPAGRKLGVCCAKETARYSITSALAYRAGDGGLCVAATDGKVLSVVPLDIVAGPESPTLIPSAAVNGNGKDKTVEVNGEVRATSGKKTEVMPLPEQSGVYPAFKDVFPDSEALAGYSTLTLNAEQLSRVASAISCDGVVTLMVPSKADYEKGKPIVVVQGGDEVMAGVGLIMPIVDKAFKATTDATAAARKQYVSQQIANMPEKTIRIGKVD